MVEMATDANVTTSKRLQHFTGAVRLIGARCSQGRGRSRVGKIVFINAVTAGR